MYAAVPLDGSSAQTMRTRLEVDGEVIATTREGTPADVAGELADELRRRGIPAAAAGVELRVGALGINPEPSKPASAPLAGIKGPAKTIVHRDVKPEKRRRSGSAS